MPTIAPVGLPHNSILHTERGWQISAESEASKKSRVEPRNPPLSSPSLFSLSHPKPSNNQSSFGIPPSFQTFLGLTTLTLSQNLGLLETDQCGEGSHSKAQSHLPTCLRSLHPQSVPESVLEAPGGVAVRATRGPRQAASCFCYRRGARPSRSPRLLFLVPVNGLSRRDIDFNI